MIYHFATLDPDLGNEDLRNKLQAKLEKEMKDIELPPQTAINKFETLGKPKSSILVITRYRSELDRKEFLKKMQMELVKRAWVFYGTRADGGYSFCRGKLDANLNLEGKNGIWSDGGDYWTLSYSLGLRAKNLIGDNSLPKSCSEAN